MSDNNFLADLPLAGELVATDFETGPTGCARSSPDHAYDGHVGSRLLSENDRVRVWEIRLAPGERWHAHRHVLDYFWTAVKAGRSRQHTMTAPCVKSPTMPARTRHFRFGPGEFLLHDIENIGDDDLVFTTVEHLDSANAPFTGPFGEATSSVPDDLRPAGRRRRRRPRPLAPAGSVRAPDGSALRGHARPRRSALSR